MNSNEDITRRIILRFTLIVVLLLLIGGLLTFRNFNKGSDIRSFEECQEAGYPVLETYPEQCRVGTRTFVKGS